MQNFELKQKAKEIWDALSPFLPVGMKLSWAEFNEVWSLCFYLLQDKAHPDGEIDGLETYPSAIIVITSEEFSEPHVTDLAITRLMKSISDIAKCKDLN